MAKVEHEQMPKELEQWYIQEIAMVVSLAEQLYAAVRHLNLTRLEQLQLEARHKFPEEELDDLADQEIAVKALKAFMEAIKEAIDH